MAIPTIEKSSRRSGSHLAYLGAGLVVGSAIGAAEVALRLWGNEDPSIVRRGFELLRYGAFWNALFFGLILLVAGIVIRLGRRHDLSLAREGNSPLLTGTLVATLIPAGVLLVLGERLLRHSAIVRFGLFGLVLVVGVLTAWVVAYRLATRPGAGPARFMRWIETPRVAVTLSLVVGIGSVLAVSMNGGGAPAADGATKRTTATAGDPATPDIVLIVVDTLRADVLGCYGGEAETPNLDALAQRGTLFEDVVAPSSWTRPSVASLFTSSFPWQHGCVDFGFAIADHLATLPEVLTNAGYRSMAVIGNPFVDERSGFGRGFEVFDVYTQEVETKLLVARIFDLALEFSGLWDDTRRVILPWIDPGRFPFLSTRLSFYVQDEDLNDRLERHAWPSNDRPTFLYVQYVAPHTPYLEHPLPILKSQPELAPENVDELRARYLGEVAYTDRMIGKFLERLAQDRVLDETIVVVTSDHGEEFNEHGGFEHGYGLYAEAVNVPLIIAGPGVPANTRVDGFVGLLDLAPTLLDLVDVPAPESFVGQSFAALIRSDDEHIAKPVFAETSSQALTSGRRFASVQTNEWKIIRERSLDGALLSQQIFDLESDPLELSPVLEGFPELDPLLGKLDEYEEFARKFAGGEMTDELRAKMEALGYVGRDAE